MCIDQYRMTVLNAIVFMIYWEYPDSPSLSGSRKLQHAQNKIRGLGASVACLATIIVFLLCCHLQEHQVKIENPNT